MNTFNNVQTQISLNAQSQFGSAIGVTIQGSNSNLYYSNEADNAFIVEQAIGASQNQLSIYSAQGNSLNTLGNLLNFTNRPYNTVILSCVLTGSVGATITAGLEVTYTDGFGNIYYFQANAAFTLTGGTATGNFYYVGSNPSFQLTLNPSIPLPNPILAGSLGIIASSATIVGTLTSVNLPAPYTPTTIKDEQYQDILQTVYQSSSFGLDGAIQLLISNFDFVASCVVYVGTTPSGSTVIDGKTQDYTLSYGEFLIIVYFPIPVTGSGTPYAYQVVANAIFARLNFLNFTYNLPPAMPLANQINATVTSALGNIFPISFFLEEDTSLAIIISAVGPNSIVLDSAQLTSLIGDVNNYITNIPIAGTLYFSNISQLASNYGLLMVSLEINSTPNLLFLAADADEKFLFGSLAVTYV